MADSRSDRAFSRLDLPAFGTTRNDQRQPVAQQPALVRACQQFIERRTQRLQALLQAAVREKVDFLFRKIDGRLDVHAQLRQLRGEGVYLAGKLALQGTYRGTRGLGGAAFDQVRDRLGLDQVELVVEKGTLGKFTGTCGARAELQHAGQQQVEHHRTAVGVQLQHMLAGEGGGRGEIQRQPGIDQRAIGIAEIAQHGPARCRQAAEHAGVRCPARSVRTGARYRRRPGRVVWQWRQWYPARRVASR